MKTIRLENRTGHFKFYELWAGAYVDNETGVANKAFVGCRYGRIGTEGQTALKEFEGATCKVEADKFVQAKIREKLSRGYEMIGAKVAETEANQEQLSLERR